MCLFIFVQYVLRSIWRNLGIRGTYLCTVELQMNVYIMLDIIVIISYSIHLNSKKAVFR